MAPPITDPILDAAHDANCAAIALHFLADARRYGLDAALLLWTGEEKNPVPLTRLRQIRRPNETGRKVPHTNTDTPTPPPLRMLQKY